MATRKDPVAAARAKAEAQAQAEADEALVNAVAEKVLAAAPPPPDQPPTPAPTPPAPPAPQEDPGPQYKDGDTVTCTDSRLPPGTITGEAASARCYTVTPHDGSDPYMAPESTLTPEEPMTEQTPAPAALAESLGLPVGATMGQCTQAAAKQSTDLKAARAEATAATNEAKSAALKAANVHADLADVAADKLVKGEGGWDAAVAALKTERPSLFASAAPAPTVVATAPTVVQPQQPAAVAQPPEANGPSAPLPMGVNLPGTSTPLAGDPGTLTSGPVQLRGASMHYPGN
jgi:hypothetical protein